MFANKKLQFLDCSVQIESGVIVLPEESTLYNSIGKFACPDTDQVLFLSSGELPNSNNTVCLYSANWKNHSIFQCWEGNFNLWIVSLLSDFETCCKNKK